MKNSILIFILNLLLIWSASGQENPAIRLYLQGYNVVFPGIEVAYQQPIYKYNINEQKQNKVLLNVAPVLDVYAYRGNHTGIGLTGELNAQYISAKGVIGEIYGGYGLLSTILSGTVYELNEQGVFEESTGKGNIYSSWKTGFGVGKKVELKSGKALSFHLRTGIRYAASPGAFITTNTSLGVNFIIQKDKK